MMNISVTPWSLLTFAAIGLAGCSQLETDLAQEPIPVTLHGQLHGYQSANSRSVVGGVTSNGALLMNWDVKEQIGVFAANTVNACFSSTNAQPASYTAFTGQTSGGEIPTHAYYPYNKQAVDATAIPVNIPTEQHYADEHSVAAYDIKASDAVQLRADGTFDCTMRQMGTLLRFEINLSEVSTVLGNGGKPVQTDETLRRVELQTAGMPMTGDFTYNLRDLNAGMKQSGTSTGNLNLHFTQKPTMSETVVAYAIVAPGQQQNQQLTCTLFTNKHKVTFTTPLLCNFEAGKYYVIPLNGKVYENNKQTVVVADHTEPEDVIEETANCYMINEQGEHSFLATQIGNGDKGIIPNAGFHVTTSKINPQSAKLMWQDTPDFIDAQTVELRNGRVYYTANNNVGNAQIAVYSGPNCTGDILWSWHIWGVGDTMPTDEKVINQAGAEFQVMDRALGALAMPVYGTPDIKTYTTTLYQWGRKDPIPNNAVYYVDGKQVDITTSYPVYTPQTEAEASILNSVRHCNKIMNDNEATGNWNWLGQDNPYLWGNIFKKGPAWNEGMNSAVAGAGWTHDKTIYDPSPVGYRVPNRYAFTGFAKLNDGTGKMEGALSVQDVEQYTNFVVESFKDGTIERGRPKFQNGYFFKRDNKDTQGMYFPMAGCRYAGTGERGHFGVSVDYWNSTQQVNEHKACNFSIGAYEWRDKDVMDGAGNHGSYDTDDFAYKWVANPVRCVRE